MTVNDIIALVDLKEPNSYTAAEKIKWLSDLDGKIFNEVILTHEHDDVEFTPYNIHALDPVPEGQTPPEPEDLLIGDPYGEDIYVHYLIARIAAGNAETPRYNQQIAMYNAAYSQWWNKYNSETMPLHKGCRFKF